MPLPRWPGLSWSNPIKSGDVKRVSPRLHRGQEFTDDKNIRNRENLRAGGDPLEKSSRNFTGLGAEVVGESTSSAKEQSNRSGKPN